MGRTLADIGTGSGILALEMAQTGGLVLATDVNPAAVECAQRNAELNKLSQNVDVLCSDGLEAIRISKRFSAVVSNPPYLQQERALQPKTEDRAWAGGDLGTETLMRFVRQAVRHLKAAGSVWIVLSSSSGIEEPLRQMSRLGLRAQVVDEAKLFFERLVVVRVAQAWAEDRPA